MKILIVTGGTGGHVFPAISLADKIKEINPNIEIVFCIDRRVGINMLDKFNYQYFVLDAPRMPYGFSIKWIKFFIQLMFSFSGPRYVLKKTDPDIVVGFGAYISGPMLMEAKKRHKRIFIHEQNVIPGRANKILLKIADKIALAFDNRQYSKDPRCAVTGNPIRNELLEDLIALDKERARRLLGLNAECKTILVMGGSLGSRRINEIFLKMLKGIPDEVLDCLQIIHLTSKDDFDNVQSMYKNIKINSKVYPFFERMGLLYKAADFAVSRAGAITISELCAFGLPAILIPYPLAGSHQAKNAEFLQERDAAIMIKEEQLENTDILKTAALSLIEDKKTLSLLSQNIKKLARPDAAEYLAEFILKNA